MLHKSVSVLVVVIMTILAPAIVQANDEVQYGESPSESYHSNDYYSNSSSNCTNSMVENTNCTINTVRNGINLIQQIVGLFGGNNNNSQGKTQPLPQNYSNQIEIGEIDFFDYENDQEIF